MNVVVNFLTMLVSDESNGSVKRMLSVCAEFERIARVVLDKAEKAALTTRKRKVAPETMNMMNTPSADTSNIPDTTSMNYEKPVETNSFSPNGHHHQNPRPTSQPPIELVSPNPSDMMSGTFGDVSSGNLPTYSHDTSLPSQPALQATTTTSPAEAPFYPFQQPFVPQDLWQMPMTLEWDWADFSTLYLPTADQPDMFQATMHNGM